MQLKLLNSVNGHYHQRSNREPGKHEKETKCSHTGCKICKLKYSYAIFHISSTGGHLLAALMGTKGTDVPLTEDGQRQREEKKS